MKRLLVSVLVCLLAPMQIAPAFAQREKSIVPSLDEESRKGEMARMAAQHAEAHFDAADEDKNGVLSREEVARHFPYIAENFDRYDTNHDGVLSWEEYVGHDKWQRKAKDK